MSSKALIRHSLNLTITFLVAELVQENAGHSFAMYHMLMARCGWQSLRGQTLYI